MKTFVTPGLTPLARIPGSTHRTPAGHGVGLRPPAYGMEIIDSHPGGVVPVVQSAPAIIQPKLRVSSPNDQSEIEAERVAEQVLRQPDAAPAVTTAAAPAQAQRMCKECESELKTHKADGQGAMPGDEKLDGGLCSAPGALPEDGQPLPQSSQDYFGSRLGHDFSTVRIHTGPQASRLASSVNARAFTYGRDIVFGAGEYAPETPAGKQVLAHELVHVIQQKQAAPQIQRLAVTEKTHTKGTCGGRNIQWVFGLDNPAASDGYIVQQITRSRDVKTCPSLVSSSSAPDQFWEAWTISAGEKLNWYTKRVGWTDGSKRSDNPNTNGQDSAFGQIKFFAKSVTGDLGNHDVAPSDPSNGWGPGKVPASGSLPSTPSKPAWWDTAPVEGPATRSVNATWNCCDADSKKHTYTLNTTP